MTAAAPSPCEPNAAIKRIVILGGGTAGWMAAAALARALANTGTHITVVESAAIGIVGVGEATVPSIHAFNALLGLPKADFMRECQATFKLGIDFIDWGERGRHYMHAFSPYGLAGSGGNFHRLWMRHAHDLGRTGVVDDIDRYNIGTLAARLGKVPPPSAKPRPQDAVNFAYHFDAALYGQYLRRYAERHGVVRIDGEVVSVGRATDTGHIEVLQLQTGQAVAGDFFIDCSGFKGVLISGAMGVGYQSWSHWLPCDRAVAVPSGRRGAPEPYTRSTAVDAGWMWRIPLQHRNGNGYVYSSAHLSDDAAAVRLLETLDGPAMAEPRLLRFETGRRARAWSGNCLALGLAAGFLEPLESTSIHLIQTSLFRLLSLFPDKGFNAAEIDEFNRQTTEEYENVRDFLIAHYKLTRRTDTAFWTQCGDMAVPDRVADILALFAANGRLPSRPEQLFSAQSWLAVLMGQGDAPQGYDPLLRPMPGADVAAHMATVRQTLAGQVAGMPRHDDVLGDFCPTGVAS